MAHHRRTGLALLLASGVAAATLPIAVATTASATTATAASPAAAAQLHRAKKPRMKLSDRTIHKGQTVKLTITRLPKKSASLYITICGNPPGATNCDVDLRHVKQVSYNGSGKLKTTYKVKVTKFATASGKINCKKVQCVIGTTNALNPKDRSYNSWAKFKVVKH